MLTALEQELEGEPFLVVGVHSPKFPNERDTEMVREAVRRFGVAHPVVVDSGHEIWSRFGVRAWPTLVLVDAEGAVVAAASGEPSREALAAAVREVLEDGRRRGVLDGRPLPLRREPARPGSLAYPGKVIAAAGRLFVADTGHDQVVVCDREGWELARIGCGESGFRDGPVAEAAFRHPNGLALAGDTLYVADTGNHAIRAVDLAEGTVATVAGTGEKGRLRSPWDLALDGERLFVAMAGSHQIWALEGREASPFAGTGHELRRDGPAESAAFAQPSGLALADGLLYVADSEVSSVRAINLASRTVRTVCGSGELFGFGDRDGVGEEVLLQHPLGIAAGPGGLFLADTFNHKLKRVDPSNGECRTLFGNGEPERLAELLPGAPLAPASAEDPVGFEPEGLAVDGGELLVADTNNHRILGIRLADGTRRVLVGS